jgi:predicted MFS family arabinose efflux permease
MTSHPETRARSVPPAFARPKPAAQSGLALSIVLTLAMTLPMLILYAIGTLGPFLVRDLGIKPGLLGYATMSTFGLAAVLSPFAGIFVDRIGSRRSLGLLFLAVAVAYAAIIALPGFLGVVAAVAVCGIAQALSNPVTNVLIARQVPPEKKAFVVGLKQSGVQMGALFAGLVMPGIALMLGWRAVFALLVPLALILAAAAPLVASPHVAATRNPMRLARPNRLLLLLMSVQLCAGMALSAFVTFLPIVATTLGVSRPEAGAMIATFGAFGVLSRVLLTPLGARLPDESWLLFALLVLSAVALSLTMGASPAAHWPLWLGAAGMGLTAVATNAIAMGMILRDPSFGSPASASGWLSSAFFGGFSLGAPAYGAIFNTALSTQGAWSATIAIVACGCLLTLALAKARRKDIAGRGGGTPPRS